MIFPHGQRTARVRALPPFIRFAIVGLTTTLIDITCFSVLTILGLLIPVANLLSYSCGIAVSYFLNRTWTFRAAPCHNRAIKFVASTLVGLLLSTLLVVTFNLALVPVASKVLSVPIVFFWNYGTARLWVFKQQ